MRQKNSELAKRVTLLYVFDRMDNPLTTVERRAQTLNMATTPFTNGFQNRLLRGVFLNLLEMHLHRLHYKVMFSLPKLLYGFGYEKLEYLAQTYQKWGDGCLEVTTRFDYARNEVLVACVYLDEWHHRFIVVTFQRRCD